MAHFDRDETSKKVKEIVAEILNSDISKIHEDSTFETLGADSLDMLQIIMKIEDVFGIEISDDDARAITTVAQAVDGIQKLRTK